MLTMKTNVTTEGHVLELINILSSGFSTHLHYRNESFEINQEIENKLEHMWLDDVISRLDQVSSLAWIIGNSKHTFNLWFLQMG